MGLGISSLRLGLHARGAGAAFTPASLFASGEAGVWFDPSDLTSMYQGRTGTTAAAVDSPVGQLLDKSGNGNHAVAPTDAARPILRESGGLYYLEFDGSDDCFITPTITPGVDKVQVFAGVRKLTDLSDQIIIEHSANLNNNTGAFYLTGAAASSAVHNFVTRGTLPTFGSPASATGLTAPITSVLMGQGDIAGDVSRIRRNGVTVATNNLDLGAGNFSAVPLYIGRRAGTTLPFNGQIYSIIVRYGANLSADTIAAAEAYVAAKTGVTL